MQHLLHHILHTHCSVCCCFYAVPSQNITFETWWLKSQVHWVKDKINLTFQIQSNLKAVWILTFLNFSNLIFICGNVDSNNSLPLCLSIGFACADTHCHRQMKKTESRVECGSMMVPTPPLNVASCLAAHWLAPQPGPLQIFEVSVCCVYIIMALWVGINHQSFYN